MRLGLLVLFAASTFGQAKPDAAEILAKVKATLKDVKSYDLSFAITLHDSKSGKDNLGAVRVAAAVESERYRIEFSGPAFDSDPVIGDGTAIYDGSTFWIYVPERNEYRTETISVDRPGIEPKPSKVIDAEGMGQYVRLVERFDSSHFLREESISDGGGDSKDCFVLEKEPGVMMWIDKSNYHLLREDYVVAEGAYSMIINLKLNEPLADDMFKFVPPPGARNLGKP